MEIEEKTQENKEYKNSNKLKGCWLNVWVAEIPHKTNMSSCTDLVRDPNHATNYSELVRMTN